METLSQQIIEELKELNQSRRIQIEQYLNQILEHKKLLAGVGILTGISLVAIGFSYSSLSQKIFQLNTALNSLKQSIEAENQQALQNEIRSLSHRVQGKDTQSLITQITELESQLKATEENNLEQCQTWAWGLKSDCQKIKQ